MIPVLITIDLETAKDHELIEQGEIFVRLYKELNELGISTTSFVTSEFATRFSEQLQASSLYKNEFGLHGRDHSVKENYSQMTMNEIRSKIHASCGVISEVTQSALCCFRGPFMSTSSSTQQVLIENNFKADYSVCSQRIDYMNSRGGSLSWLFSPRTVYHPSISNPYKRGELPLWVIPLSCFGIPFISGIMYIFGLRFMKHFFRLLLEESLRTGKPIVYLFHTYEFAKPIIESNQGLVDSRKSIIHSLYIHDRKKRYEMNLDLIKYMLSFDGVHFFKNSDYLQYIEERMD